jgi:hypothetical protein
MTTSAIRRYSNTKSIFVAALLLLTGETACKRSGFDLLQHGWTKVGSEPLAVAPLLRQAEESSCIWQIGQRAGKVTVSRQTILNEHPQEIRVQTPNGTLIGSNHGEWGGALTISKGEGNPPLKLLDGDVLKIFPAREGFLIITGSLPSNEGALWLYSKSINRGWTIEKKADLLGYPLAAYETTSGVWLATGDSIYLLDDKFEVQNHNDMPWLQLHPNSIAADNSGAVYVGMQAFVVRLTPTWNGY